MNQEKIKDPIQQIEENLNLSKIVSGLPMNEWYWRDIQNLLTLTSIYEKELLQFVPVTYLDDIKKEIFK